MYLLGIDVGTTGTKSVVISETGDIVSARYKSYPLIHEGPHIVEQDAGLWWEALKETVRGCTAGLNGKIAGISLSTQGATLLPVDESNKPLSHARVWMDTRAGAISKRINEQFGESYLYRKTGWRLAECFNFAQIAWMRENEKELFDRTAKFVATPEYIYHLLCGRHVVDESNASISQLYNITTRDWDEDLLRLCGIDRFRISKVEKSGSLVGELTEWAARETGLVPGIPIVCGAHDQYAATVGNNAISTGDVMLSCGTSWGVMGVTEQLSFDDDAFFAPGRHVIDGLFGLFAYTPSGGCAFEWVRANVALQSDGRMETFASIDENAEKIRPGAEGLLFFPHFAGTSCPTWSLKSRTSLVGLELKHTRYHIARACMEGIAYDILWMLEKQKQNALRVNQLKAFGGATKSLLWMQIVSDIIEVPVLCPYIPDIPAVGAALIAGVGTGVFKDYQDAFDRVNQRGYRIIEPNSANAGVYRTLYEEYKSCFASLRKFYDERQY